VSDDCFPERRPWLILFQIRTHVYGILMMCLMEYMMEEFCFVLYD
jgi:hypothetical protein